MSSAHAFNLNQSNILSYGKELRPFLSEHGSHDSLNFPPGMCGFSITRVELQSKSITRNKTRLFQLYSAQVS